MEGSKIAFDWTIDPLKICLTCPSPLRLWQSDAAGGVCVGSNLISHYSGGSSRGIAHHKVSDACSVLSIVAAQCLTGCRWPRSQCSAGDTAPFADISCCTEEHLLRELWGPERYHTESKGLWETFFRWQTQMEQLTSATTWNCFFQSFSNMCYTIREYAVLYTFCKLQFSNNLCKIRSLPSCHHFVMSEVKDRQFHTAVPYRLMSYPLT